MDRIIDPRLVEIQTTRACSGLPAEVTSNAFRVLRLTMAARSWEDFDIFTRVAALADGRYAVPIHRKWFLVFDWVPALGARNLALQRF